MGLDVWFRNDVERILTALAAAGELHGPEYRRALEDTALAFGLCLALPAARPGAVDALGWSTVARAVRDRSFPGNSHETEGR